MKTLRMGLLVVLALLLPLRGAMAAAMLCPMAAGGAPASAHAHHGAVADAAPIDHAAMHHGDGAAPHEAAPPAPAAAAEPHAAPATCNLCCDFCTATPLVASVQDVPNAPEQSALSFPDLSTPAPSFFSDGPERPPRSS